MTKLKFAERFIYLDRRPIRFNDRPYLPAIYESTARKLVVRASRQVEKTAFLVNSMLHDVVTHRGIKILFVFPRESQVSVFSHDRLMATIRQSPLLNAMLLDKGRSRPSVRSLRFENDSVIYIAAAFRNADAPRGVSISRLYVDEFQDIAAGDLPVLQEAMSHSPDPRTVLTGTPKLVDKQLDHMFGLSTANEWKIRCAPCDKGVILDQRCLGAKGVTCPDCGNPLDPAAGQWVPRNPTAKWGDGFWINHLMVPWLKYEDVLERQVMYDPARFRNEVLGLPASMPAGRRR